MAMCNIGLAAVAALAACAGTASAQFILGVNRDSDQIGLYSAADGSLINASFIDVGGQVANGTLVEALQVGNQIWISDQTEDAIHRFSASGSFLGSITGALDNIRGMEVVGNTVYVSNDGTNNGASGPSIVTIDATSGAITGSFGRNPAEMGAFDVLRVGNELYVSNIESGFDAVDRYDFAGNYLGSLVTSDGVASFDFLQQLALKSNGNILGAAFSTPQGIYEFTPGGVDLGVVLNAPGPRGVIELGNGSIMWTNGSGIWIDGTLAYGFGSAGYVSHTTIPAPGAVALLGLGGLAAARRRR